MISLYDNGIFIVYVLVTCIFLTLLRSIFINISPHILIKLKPKLTITKFQESLWKLWIHFILLNYTYYVGFQSDYIYNIEKCWSITVPTKYEYILYILQLGYGIHDFILQFFNTKRSDYIEMFIHHSATILLLWGSYIIGVFRIGVIVLMIHEPSEIFLRLAKLFHYAKYKIASTITFGIFVCVFFVFRLILFPLCLWMILTTNVIDNSVLTLFMSLLLILQVLHILWFGSIIKVIKMVKQKGELKDVRSDDENDENDENDKNK